MEKPPDKSAEEVSQNHGISQLTTFVLRRKEQEGYFSVEQISWSWKRKPLQGYGHRVSLRYRKKVLSDIELVLTKIGGQKLLQQFVEGCFGHLLRFIGGASCNIALHELISREITLAGARDDEVWFRIGETNIRFAPEEYALITGLHFGSSSFDPMGTYEMPPEGVFNRLCNGHPISSGELWNKFNQHHLSGSPEDYLKVAHVLALNHMLLGYQQTKTVGQWMWALVDDLDSWNRFPWGAYTYKALMHYHNMLPRNRAIPREYNFRGPVWALQIWAYEAIPWLGNMSAVVTRQVTVPRCLKWSFPGGYKKFPKQFLDRKLDCCVTLEPTDEEKRQPYWLSLQTEQPLGVRYDFRRGRKHGPQGAVHHRRVATAASLSPPRPRCSCIRTPVVESSLGEPGNLEKVPDSDASVRSARKPSARPSRRRNRKQASICSSLSSGGRPRHARRWPDLLDGDQFVDQVSSRVVDRMLKPMAAEVTQILIESMVKLLIPDLKQHIGDLIMQARKVDDQLQTENPSCNVDHAKADEKKEGQSLDGGSSSMHISRQTIDEPSPGLLKKPVPENAKEQCEVLMNDPRSGVAGDRKLFANQEDSTMPNEESQFKQDDPVRAQSDSTEKTGNGLRRAGEADRFSSKMTKKKPSSTSRRRSRSPSLKEERSDDEGSESSPGDERRRRVKKRGKKKSQKHSEGSLSESSDSYRHWKRRNRRKRRRASSSDSDSRGSVRRHRHRHTPQHHPVS